jgi:hypothetical protein
MSLKASQILSSALLALATCAGCGSTPATDTDASTGMDASVSTDTGRTNRTDSRTPVDARVLMSPDAARPAADAGARMPQPRDGGAGATDAGMPYVPPMGARRVFSRVANRHCFSYWDQPDNDDNNRIFLTECIPAGPGAGNQSWEIIPVAGRPGAVKIRTLRDEWPENGGCWTFDTDNQIRAGACDSDYAVWNVNADAVTGEIQLASQQSPGMCIYAAEGGFALLSTCEDDVGEYFDSRPFEE